jgi:hypothetical protein
VASPAARLAVAFDGRRLALGLQRVVPAGPDPKVLVFDSDGRDPVELWPHGPHPFKGRFELGFAAPGQPVLLLPALPLDDSLLIPAWAEVYEREAGQLCFFGLYQPAGRRAAEPPGLPAPRKARPGWAAPGRSGWGNGSSAPTLGVRAGPGSLRGAVRPRWGRR